MALADYDDYKARIPYPDGRVTCMKSVTTVAGKPVSWWRATGIPAQGAIPGTSGASVDRTTLGAIGQQDNGGNLHAWLSSLDIGAAGALEQGMVIIADRLLHNGGLSGTTTTAQTVGGALTRYTGGVGVFGAIEVYTQIGATATTFVTSYTDDGGNTGQASPLQVIGGTGAREAGLLIPIALAAGDRGMQAVASVTITATTGTAGSFGVTLFKPLMYLPFVAGQGFPSPSDPLLAMGGAIPEIDAEACLMAIVVSSAAGARILNFNANFGGF